MRILIAALLTACLTAGNVLAADAAGPLAPGKPAGVKKAQVEDNTILYIIGAGAVIAGIVLVASNSNGHGSAGSSSSSSNP
jgi:hypothetical protein